MIVATAGHVDHGKTSLIRHLTGVDTDRLEEEKRRGLSINLGYAYLPVDAGLPIGFIDVPGHQRFINTMISGISGIDLGMLVVAADDGVMPQTQEHLDVLSILGVRRLLLVVSKVDRATQERVDDVVSAATGLLQAYEFEQLGTFPIDNISGDGIAPIGHFLTTHAQTLQTRASDGAFRLCVDRAFTVKGAGLVVTGTTSAGVVSEGDTLNHFPSGREVKVRSLRVHDAQTHSALSGQRCAINVAGGLSLDEVSRGDWLLSPDCSDASATIDCDVALLPNAPFALKHLSPVKIHIGAQRIAGRLALPHLHGLEDKKRLEPSDTQQAQLRLDEAVPTYTRQHFVIRDHAEEVTLGGGVVLDPSARLRRKTEPLTLQRLDALRTSDSVAGVKALVDAAGWAELTSFCKARNTTVEEANKLQEKIRAIAGITILEHQSQTFAAEDNLLSDIKARLQLALRQWHADNPKARGLKASALTAAWQPVYELPLLTSVLKQSLQESALTLSEGYLSLKDFKPAKASEDEKVWAAYTQFLKQRDIQIPLLSETTEQTKFPLEKLRKAAAGAVREHSAFKVSERRFALPQHLLKLSEGVLKLSNTGDEISVIALKQEWGLGRNLVVEIVEFFDTVRFTARRGNARVILDEALPQKLFGGAKE